MLKSQEGFSPSQLPDVAFLCLGVCSLWFIMVFYAFVDMVNMVNYCVLVAVLSSPVLHFWASSGEIICQGV